MTIATYSDLKAAVGQFLAERQDLGDRIPTFIALAEAQLEREVRSYRMVKRADITLDARFVALPADHLETIRVYADAAPLQAVSPDNMAEYRADRDEAGEPRYMAFVGSEIELYPTPGTAYAGGIQYYGTIPRLSDAAPTNWMLTANSDALLYGALFHAGNYLEDNNLVKRASVLYAGAVSSINVESVRQQFPGPLRIAFRR